MDFSYFYSAYVYCILQNNSVKAEKYPFLILFTCIWVICAKILQGLQ